MSRHYSGYAKVRGARPHGAIFLHHLRFTITLISLETVLVLYVLKKYLHYKLRSQYNRINSLSSLKTRTLECYFVIIIFFASLYFC